MTKAYTIRAIADTSVNGIVFRAGEYWPAIEPPLSTSHLGAAAFSPIDSIDRAKAFFKNTNLEVVEVEITLVEKKRATQKMQDQYES